MVKCSNCNIVVDEVLVFVQNKHKVMDNESLVRICATAFTSQDVDQAKSLLFDAVQITPIPYKKRRADGKINRDLEDIINVFKQTRPELIPTFVARDLNKLPPITFDHVDVTRLLRDIMVLKEETREIKEKYLTKEEWQLESSKLCANTRTPSFNLNKNESIMTSRPSDVFVNKRCRGLNCKLNFNQECDSGPIGILNVPLQSLTVKHKGTAEQVDGSVHNSPSLSPASVTHLSVSQDENLLRVEAPTAVSNIIQDARPQVVASCTVVSTGGMCNGDYNGSERANKSSSVLVGNKGTTFADMARNEIEWKAPAPDEHWTLVQRKRLRNRFIGESGRAVTKPECNFKAAPTKVPLFIYNIDKEVSALDITHYLQNKTQMVVDVEEVSVRKDKNYAAYKIFVPKHKLPVFLDSNLWPVGVAFRRFVDFRVRRPSKLGPDCGK